MRKFLALPAAISLALALACSSDEDNTAKNAGTGGTSGTGGTAGTATAGSGGTAGTAGTATGGSAGSAAAAGTAGAAGVGAMGGAAGSSGAGGAGPECTSGGDCTLPGHSCDNGSCVADCRPGDSVACFPGDECDFTDGQCKIPNTVCFLPEGTPEPCPTASNPNLTCAAGLMCDGPAGCKAPLHGCTGVTCGPTGKCWGTDCPCDRPAPSCAPAPLSELNRADFVGSLANMSDDEGAFDIDFDSGCNAYVVTMISGPDFLRQLEPDGTLTTWSGTTNLNMGEVAVREQLDGEVQLLGQIAGTYICCATCGCVQTGMDDRLGVVELDRMSASRPLPNVLPAQQTSGTGPFGIPQIDTGPYGLTYDGADEALYAGNIDANGDFHRINLSSGTSAPVATFPARVTAARAFDIPHLLVAVEGGTIYKMRTSDGMFTPWATVAGDVTSIQRDFFTGDVYAEIATTPPAIVRISADGATVGSFQQAPFLGRIAIAPDGFLYHLSVFPNVKWMTGTPIVRWALPTKR